VGGNTYISAGLSETQAARPQTNQRGLTQDLRNAAVDEYISLGYDKRPRGDIEPVAIKLVLSNGTVYRRCEGTGREVKYGYGEIPLLFWIST
jgi:hypothetical protein